ncbi:glycosyltransferase family 4 protein [Deinococcus sp. NW-56]|uniref:glycosyltransferase family 4 protein n=1 Tax=Deinococcus sp. NW-56 TaxID=2080419 RepID=UPI000CF40379|nr:glycosyltransferase family 4 protein [Deinococcus sp. NW-56]
MRPLNIVIYNITPPGGVERAAVNLANSLADHYQVYIVSLYSGEGQPFYPLDKRVTITHLGVPFTPGLRHYVAQNARTLRALRSRLTFTPDTITLGMSVNPNVLLALLKAAGTSGRFIACEHMNYEDAPRLAQMLRRVAYPRLDDVVVLTEADRDTFQRQLGVTPHVIPNQLPFFPDAPASLSAKRLIGVGRYVPMKGFDRLIEALAPVLREFPDWTLDLYGKGEQEADLRHLILREGLSNVRLCPATREIERAYLGSSVMLVPSRHESFGMVLLEAQACGVPVVAFDVPHGPRAILSGGGGVLVPDGDGAAFAEAVRSLIVNQERRRELGAQARQNAMRYAPEPVRQQWLDLLGTPPSSHDL